jgi:hypothetical protein
VSSFTLSRSPPFTIGLSATSVKDAMTRMGSDKTFGANAPTAILLLFQRKSEGGQTIHGLKVSLWICLLRDPKASASANSLESLPMIIVLLQKFCDESFQLRLPTSSAALPSRGDQRGPLGCGQARESFRTRGPSPFPTGITRCVVLPRRKQGIPRRLDGISFWKNSSEHVILSHDKLIASSHWLEHGIWGRSRSRSVRLLLLGSSKSKSSGCIKCPEFGVSAI